MISVMIMLPRRKRRICSSKKRKKLPGGKRNNCKRKRDIIEVPRALLRSTVTSLRDLVTWSMHDCIYAQGHRWLHHNTGRDRRDFHRSCLFCLLDIIILIFLKYRRHSTTCIYLQLFRRNASELIKRKARTKWKKTKLDVISDRPLSSFCGKCSIARTRELGFFVGTSLMKCRVSSLKNISVSRVDNSSLPDSLIKCQANGNMKESIIRLVKNRLWVGECSSFD